MTTVDEVKHIVAEQLDISEKNFGIDENIVELGADSLNIIEIALAVEEAFDVHIPDNEFNRLTTVRDIAKYISQLDS